MTLARRTERGAGWHGAEGGRNEQEHEIPQSHGKRRVCVAQRRSMKGARPVGILSWLFRKKNKCPGCGFDLDGLTMITSATYHGIRCPMCGTDISSRITRIDLRPESERQLALQAQDDLGGEDEQLAQRLRQLQRGHESPAAKAEIRRIGEDLGANGGNDQMARVAYRVEYLGGSSRQLEFDWAGICGWQH